MLITQHNIYTQLAVTSTPGQRTLWWIYHSCHFAQLINQGSADEGSTLQQCCHEHHTLDPSSPVRRESTSIANDLLSWQQCPRKSPWS
jgi:hypothetical protein